MENNKYFKQFVDRLDVNQRALDTLKENEITTLGELSKYKKSLLRENSRCSCHKSNQC